MKTFARSFFVTLLVVLVIGVSFLAGYRFREAQIGPGSDLPLLRRAYQILLQHGLNEVPPAPALEYGMIRGMLQAYGDPFTTFSEPAQHELQSDNLEGKFGGIGARVGTDAEGYYVLYPYVNSPAARAGVQEGDRLLGVDELTVTPQTGQDMLLAAIRGPVGETVRLRVGRPPDFAPLEIAVRREEISLPSVTWHLESAEPRLGVIEINIVAVSTPEEVQHAATDLQGRGAVALALDLRNNYGGLLEAGVETARLFLEQGVVIEQQYRGQEVKRYPVNHPGPLADIPLAVLVNGNTASAAEIIAGALQAQGRAVLIGTPTYGKDTIQLVFELQDGSSLHVTAARWWLPGLNFPNPDPQTGNLRGLLPDVMVDIGLSTPDPFIQAAIAALFEP